MILLLLECAEEKHHSDVLGRSRSRLELDQCPRISGISLRSSPPLKPLSQVSLGQEAGDTQPSEFTALGELCEQRSHEGSSADGEQHGTDADAKASRGVKFHHTVPANIGMLEAFARRLSTKVRACCNDTLNQGGVFVNFVQYRCVPSQVLYCCLQVLPVTDGDAAANPKARRQSIGASGAGTDSGSVGGMSRNSSTSGSSNDYFQRVSLLSYQSHWHTFGYLLVICLSCETRSPLQISKACSRHGCRHWHPLKAERAPR